jgi:anthranilate synthase/aminodeoxychorismate synthase-like glutamine amidotransferase
MYHERHMRTVLIDNFDSFTYNLVHYFQMAGSDVSTFRNNRCLEDVIQADPQFLVFSPGPGRPEDSGLCLEALRYFAGKIPILGVCLGHQIISHVFGGKVGHAQVPVHGKVHRIRHTGQGIFRDLPRELQVTRYHSLSIETMPEDFLVTAELTEKPNEIMAIQHRDQPIFGVQFHPEAVLTEQGNRMIENFLQAAVDGT